MKLALRSLLSISCLAVFLTVGTSAHADTFTFSWESTGNLVMGPGSGTLTAVTDLNIPNALDITSISGTINGISIVGLLPCTTYDPNNPCGSGGSLLYDNLLYPDGTGIDGLTVLDFRGLGLELGNGVDGSYYASSSHQISFITNIPHDEGSVVGFSIDPIPEPGSFLLLGTGLLGIAGSIRRRIQS